MKNGHYIEEIVRKHMYVRARKERILHVRWNTFQYVVLTIRLMGMDVMHVLQKSVYGRQVNAFKQDQVIITLLKC